MTYEQLQQAIKVFGLSDRATLKEITARHRQLVRQFHPDSGNSQGVEQIQRINAARKILAEYCKNYKFSFSREEFYEQNPEERLREQFANDPVWGKG